MLTGRNKELYEKAAAKRERCRAWLLPYVLPGQPRTFTKEELRSVAIKELGVSKNSFDFAWVAVVEDTGRHDWYAPIPRRRQPRH